MKQKMSLSTTERPCLSKAEIRLKNKSHFQCVKKLFAGGPLNSLKYLMEIYKQLHLRVPQRQRPRLLQGFFPGVSRRRSLQHGSTAREAQQHGGEEGSIVVAAAATATAAAAAAAAVAVVVVVAAAAAAAAVAAVVAVADVVVVATAVLLSKDVRDIFPEPHSTWRRSTARPTA